MVTPVRPSLADAPGQDEGLLLTPCPLDENGDRILAVPFDFAEVSVAITNEWQSDKIKKLGDGWRCLHCNGARKGLNHTKALNHVL